MPSVKGTRREVSFLVLLLFQIPLGGYTHPVVIPWFLGEALSPWREEKGPEPHGQGGRELRLVCVWAAHLFSLLPTSVSHVHRNAPSATHWPLVRFRCSLPFTTIFLCQLLPIFRTALFRLGALHLHAGNGRAEKIEVWAMGVLGVVQIQPRTEKQQAPARCGIGSSFPRQSCSGNHNKQFIFC